MACSATFMNFVENTQNFTMKNVLGCTRAGNLFKCFYIITKDNLAASFTVSVCWN